MRSLENKVVYLTGASKGIGRAIALRLAPENIRLAICGRDGSALGEVAESAGQRTSEPVFPMSFDLSEEPAILEFYRNARERLGPPDILINNAGFNSRKAPLWEVATEEFDSIISVNLRAPFILMREAFRDMKGRGGGHIVNILSTVCYFDNETMGVYSAAKRGLQALTGIFRKEARPHNIKVSSIYPGGTDTAFRPEPRPDYLKPESVADAVHAVLTLPEDLVVHDITFRPMVETNF